LKFSKVDGALMPVTPEDQELFSKLGENVIFECEIVTEKKRTLTQNNSLHLYFKLLAEALNNAGLDIRKTLKEEVEIPWCKESVKQHLWKPIQAVMEKGDFTTELKTATVSEVYNVLSRHISQRFGINVDWPSNRG